MVAAELVEQLKQQSLTETGEDGKPMQLGEFQGLVSRNQRLNESARECQRRRRGTKGRRVAVAAKEAKAAEAAANEAKAAADAEAARLAEEAEAARVAAEEEAARVAAEEEAARVAEAERAAATVLQCVWRRETALLDYENMKRKWAATRMMAATRIQALHRRKVGFSLFFCDFQ